jgi:hypothetical protein
LLDDLLDGFDLELATVLSRGLAHGIIILAEPHDSKLGVHFPGARSVRRKLRQMGKWPEDGDASDADVACGGDAGEQLLLELDAAAVQGVALSGERAGRRDVRIGGGSRNEPFVKGPLCADFDGFSLHGAVRVAAGDRKRLEHLCRYAGRPAIAESRLSLRPDGRVAYAFNKTWRDRTTHVVMEPQVLIERLLALVPRPRRHLVTYHGVLAPGASMRDLVVPQADEDGEQEEVDEGVADAEEARSDEVAPLSVGQQVARVPHRPGKRRRGVRRTFTWAELLRRVFSHHINCIPHRVGDYIRARHAPVPSAPWAGDRLRQTSTPVG